MGTRFTVVPRAGVARPVPDAPWDAVLAGMREGAVLCDQAGAVRAVTPVATAMLPTLTVGEPVDAAGCAALAELVHRGPGSAGESDGAEIEVGLRRVRVRAHRVDDEQVCWYLLDVTDDPDRADSLRAARDRARFLAEAGRALHGVLHLDRTVRTVAELAVPRLGEVALVLVNPGGDTVLWARADAGARRAATGSLTLADLRATPRLHEALAGGAVPDEWSTVELADLDVWPDGGVGGRRLAAVPVPTTGIARAVLVVGSPPRGIADELLDDQGGAALRELADAYASRAGAALAAAALFREQSHLGTVLQESLAPPPLPSSPDVVLGSAYRPARETMRVGGDFYEVLPPRDGTVGFLLGDVCGKGIDAAVLSGRVRQSLHALRLLERRPARLLELLNTAMLDAAQAHGEDPRFATMVLGEARHEPGRGLVLGLATGGHPPPLVLRADGTVETAPVEGTLVGAVRAARFGYTEVVLAPGELCLLYSDGVTEARGPGGFYGEERLEAALATCRGAPAAVTCERVAQLLGEWLDGRDHDDVALLALQAPDGGDT